MVAFFGDRSVHVCLEGTGGYERELLRFLLESGIPSTMVNPLQVRRFAQGMGYLHKTDKVDARAIGAFCKAKQPEPTQLEDVARTELRQLVGVWKDLQSQFNQVRARLKSPMLPGSARPCLERLRDSLAAEMKEMDAQIDLLLSRSAELARDVELLDSIPGVARRSAIAVLAHLPSGELRSARGLANYAGLVPGQKESGSSYRRKSKIGSVCNRELRKTLFMCGMVARRHSPELKDFALSLVARGKAKMQAIVAIMRKLAHAIYAILTTRKPYDSKKLCPRT